MDETYIKVNGQWKYLYRAIDKHGNTIDFLLAAHRDKKAALRLFKKAVGQHGLPEKITIEERRQCRSHRGAQGGNRITSSNRTTEPSNA